MNYDNTTCFEPTYYMFGTYLDFFVTNWDLGWIRYKPSSAGSIRIDIIRIAS